MAIPPSSTRPAFMTRGPLRLWAAGSLLAVTVVLAAALGGRALALRARAAADRVPPPALPLPALAAVPLGGEPRLLALDAQDGRVILYMTAGEGLCPPGTACRPASSPALLLLDADGQPLARVPLGADAAAVQARLLLCDQATRSALLIGPGGVTRYSALTGAPLGTYALPDGARPDDPTGAALDTNGTLFLTGAWGVAALDEATGEVRARQALAGGQAAQGLVYAPATNRLFVLTTAPTGQARLRTFDAGTLAPGATAALPPGTRLGPLDPDGRLPLLLASGAIWWLPAGVPGQGGPPAPSPTAPGFAGARALGWHIALGHIYVLSSSALTITTEGGRPLAALPLTVDWPANLPLASNPADGALYLPVEPATLLIVRDEARNSRAPLDALGAAILARAALSRLLPPADQDPPFIAAQRFPLTSASEHLTLWVHSSDLGWLGPYTGQASTSIQAEAGGAYGVEYTLTWHQLFTRSHEWRLAVSANGAAQLTSERGDALP